MMLWLMDDGISSSVVTEAWNQPDQDSLSLEEIRGIFQDQILDCDLFQIYGAEDFTTDRVQNREVSLS